MTKKNHLGTGEDKLLLVYSIAAAAIAARTTRPAAVKPAAGAWLPDLDGDADGGFSATSESAQLAAQINCTAS